MTHLDPSSRRNTLPEAGTAPRMLVLAHAIFLLQLACLGDEAARGKVAVIDHTTGALTSAQQGSANGTYGGACRNRTGAWSLAIDSGAALDFDELSVLRNDVDCVLSLTSLNTTDGTIAPTAPIVLATDYGVAPSAFGSPVQFYADAKLSDVTFADDFVLTLLYSDDPSLRTLVNTARPVPPTVIARLPLPNATNVSIATRPIATFSTAMDPATLTAGTFTLTLQSDPTPIPGSVSVNVANDTATFTPNAALELASSYEVTVTTGAQDARHTALVADDVWTFTTAAVSQGPVYLLSATSFAVLAGSTVTNTGNTSVTGDLGVSPGGAITGFPPATVSGTIHLADSAATQAKTDLAAAYNDAATRNLGAIPIIADLGGQTLTPGLYNGSSSLAISLGNLTLDALGEEDAVFLIQAGSSLTTASSSQVILTNGAKSSNVYWLIGSFATLGSTSVFEGTIMANDAITLNTGAVLNGRALARVGAVTLDDNDVVTPAP
jgi:ice-binding like protein/Big-like domain-containing protein